MANRPVFTISEHENQFFLETGVDFTFYNGFAAAQKSKSIWSLHESAKALGFEHILEVSTKSDNILGWKLSAFNLMVDLNDGKKIPLECAFQGSKVFKDNIQYKDIYFKSAIEAKKDIRLKNSGEIIGFNFLGKFWENTPKTAFYDWLYIWTLYKNYPEIIKILTNHKSFTDIEFNPKKSLNCQARSCAILVSLVRKNLLHKAMNSKETFMNIIYKKEPYQGSLF